LPEAGGMHGRQEGRAQRRPGVAMRHWVLFLTAALLLAAGGIAEGAPAFCSRLQEDYLALGDQTYQDSYQYDRARAAYENVRNQARAAGCIGGFLIFRPRQSGQCPAIMARLRQVQRDYARAGGSFGFLGFGRSNVEMERDRLRTTLSLYGCDIPQIGGFRTVCVRTCDGYYFPISNGTGRSRFAVDRAVCQRIYSPDKGDLYFYQAGGEPDQMVSLDGSKYASQPFAFSYRAAYNPSCAAELSSGLAALAAAAKNRKSPIALALLPVPAPRPNGEDPETAMDTAGALVLTAGGDPADTVVAGADAQAVRTVGPAYYYAPPIKLDALGRKPVRPASLPFISPAEASEITPRSPEP